MNTTRKILIAAVVAATAASLSACATRAPSTSIVLYYTSGAHEDKKWHECIEPGTSGTYPVDDEIFALPTTMRQWNILKEGGDSDDPIVSGTQPVVVNNATQAGPEVAVYATTEFYLNYDCSAGAKSPIVRFWEQTGRRDWCNKGAISKDGEDGFDVEAFRCMLKNTVVPAEVKALSQETRKYNADHLDANTDNVWAAMERSLAPTFGRMLREKLGGDFFCGTGYLGGAEVTWTEPVLSEEKTEAAGQPVYEDEEKTGKCPPVRIQIVSVDIADPKIKASRDGVYIAEQNAKAEKIEAQGQADRAATLEGVGNSPGYVRLQEIEAQKAAAEACKTNAACTVIIDQTGDADVNVGGR